MSATIRGRRRKPLSSSSWSGWSVRSRPTTTTTNRRRPSRRSWMSPSGWPDTVSWASSVPAAPLRVHRPPGRLSRAIRRRARCTGARTTATVAFGWWPTGSCRALRVRVARRHGPWTAAGCEAQWRRRNTRPSWNSSSSWRRLWRIDVDRGYFAVAGSDDVDYRRSIYVDKKKKNNGPDRTYFNHKGQ